MKIFVTGATGFIGMETCRILIAGGHEVVALARNVRKAKDLPDGVQVVEGDLSSFKNHSFQIPECDAVVHLAAALVVKNQSDYAANHQADVDLVEYLKSRKGKLKRFVFCSSLAAGGPSGIERPLDETDPPKPVDVYGKSKLRTEQYLQSAPFPTTSFRPPMVLGPGSIAALPLFKMAKIGIGFEVAKINQILSFINVVDLAESILKMTEDVATEHRLYYTAHEESFDIKALWETMERAFGRKIFVAQIPKRGLYAAAIAMSELSKVFNFDNRLDMKRYGMMTEPAFLCSSQRIKNELGWRANINLEDTITQSIEGYKRAGLL